MCKYCEENAFNVLIEDKFIEYGYNFFGNVGLYEEPEETDNSVVLDCRGEGHLYLRLGDRSEMGCIDHSENIKLKFCPMCGRKLGD